MGWFGNKVAKIKHDPNLTRAVRGVKYASKELRAGTGNWMLKKVPIVQWLPAYMPKWLAGDAISGISVGLLLVPQAVTYSALAGVPIQTALLSSWLPGMIYAITGTSKGMLYNISPGPTATTALFVRQISTLIATLTGPAAPPAFILASAVSFGVGVWSLILGLLNFGALFNFISLPMTLGFTVGISIPVLVTQIPLLLGEPPVGPIFTLQIPQIIKQLPQVTPAAIAIAAASIVLLVFLQFVAKKWGHKSVALLHICNARNIIVMGVFTLISFFINKDLQQPIWKVLGPIKTEIPTPQLPIMILVQNLLLPSVTLALTVALEHVVLAKSFARVNEYKSNDSQEMVYLGVINIITSFFGGMPVGGGDPARSAVLSGSQVKSPLTGIVTSVVVILAMNFGSRAFEWIPIPTIAAVITVAIANQILPMDRTAKWWKISFVDFLGFFTTFNVGLVTTGEIGLGLGFAVMIFYTLFRTMFSRPTDIVSSDLESQYNGMNPPWWHKGDRIPAGTRVIKLETDVMFANAERIRRHVVDTVFTHLSGTSIRYTSTKERAWNYRRDKRIQRLRRKAKISDADEFAPRLRILVLDLSSTSFVDGTGMHAFEDIKTELRSYGGEQVEFRFVGVSKAVQKRFERSGWNLVSPYEEYPVVTVEGEEEPIMDLLFEHLPHAIEYEAQTGTKGRNSKYSYAEGDIEYSEKQFRQ